MHSEPLTKLLVPRTLVPTTGVIGHVHCAFTASIGGLSEAAVTVFTFVSLSEQCLSSNAIENRKVKTKAVKK